MVRLLEVVGRFVVTPTGRLSVRFAKIDLGGLYAAVGRIGFIEAEVALLGLGAF
ncbi:MAG: hypothetical protein M3198_15065 [Actinomycetota bacterium]|nr:hypothetical protein [Actinomycetota bacterium]